jgi:hypothetical protein
MSDQVFAGSAYEPGGQLHRTHLAIFLQTFRLLAAATNSMDRLGTPLSRLASKLVREGIPVLRLRLTNSLVHHLLIFFVVETVRAVAILTEFSSSITDAV